MSAVAAAFDVTTQGRRPACVYREANGRNEQRTEPVLAPQIRNLFAKKPNILWVAQGTERPCFLLCHCRTSAVGRFCHLHKP